MAPTKGVHPAMGRGTLRTFASWSVTSPLNPALRLTALLKLCSVLRKVSFFIRREYIRKVYIRKVYIRKLTSHIRTVLHRGTLEVSIAISLTALLKLCSVLRKVSFFIRKEYIRKVYIRKLYIRNLPSHAQ